MYVDLMLASAARFAIGGNSSPEPPEDSPMMSEEFSNTWEAPQTLMLETRKQAPDKGRISAAIEKFKAAISSIGLWAWDKADHTITAAAKGIGAAGGTAFIAWVSGHSDTILKLIEAAQHWLERL